MRHYYVIFGYLNYNLKKIESVRGFDEIVIEILTENSPENRILRRIRTCLEIILYSLQRAFETSHANNINIKLPSSNSRKKYHYDDSKGGISVPLSVNCFDHLTSVIGIFFHVYFLIKLYSDIIAIKYRTHRIDLLRFAPSIG